MEKADLQAPMTIGDTQVAPGKRAVVDLPIAELYTHTPLTMTVEAIHGRKPGPVLFLSAAIHGDELNGVEIIRRVLRLPALKRLSGTLLAVPVVNVHGLLRHSRYMPDRRDLNRSFPGSDSGSVAARLAHVFMQEIVARADYGVDLHTGAIHRPNLPQIRADLADPATLAMAEAFSAPMLLNSPPADGTLRDVTTAAGVPVLLYEAGEALRFDEVSIRIGVAGVLNVLRHLGMLPPRKNTTRPPKPSLRAAKSSWLRAPQSGVCRALVKLGATVQKGTPVALVADPFGESELEITAPFTGVVIGRLVLPLVHEGDAVVHLARQADDDDPGTVADYRVNEMQWNGLPEEPQIV